MKKQYKSLVFLLITLCSIQSFAQTENLTATSLQKLPQHPRLFANNAKIKGLKAGNDKVSKQLLALLKLEADKYLVADKIVYPSKGFKFETMRKVQGRILSLALAYRVFGDTAYLKRAKTELIELAELPDWCPSHFLDVGKEHWQRA